MAEVAILQLIISNCELVKLLLSPEFAEEQRRKQQKCRAKRKAWTEKYILRRKQLGYSDTLLRELAEECPTRYKQFMRMTEENFNELLSLLDTKKLQRQDTNMREAIPVNLKLEVTLRYLATGDSFSSLGMYVPTIMTTE